MKSSLRNKLKVTKDTKFIKKMQDINNKQENLVK